MSMLHVHVWAYRSSAMKKTHGRGLLPLICSFSCFKRRLKAAYLRAAPIRT